MKIVVLIGLALLTAAGLSAQPIARNEITANAVPHVSATVPTVSGALIAHPSYKVTCIQSGKNYQFEIISPKSSKAEVRLVTGSGDDICLLFNGRLQTGKNLVKYSRKLPSGVYYVVSKLAGGEQFAEKVVVAK